MKKNKLYFLLLSSTLVAYIKVANAIDYTECKLEPPKHTSIAPNTRARIMFTDPYEPGIIPSKNLQNYKIITNLPDFQLGGIPKPVAFNTFNVFPAKRLMRGISLSTAQGELIIYPWFFTKENDEYYTNAGDKDYTEKKYTRDNLPSPMLEWRAMMIYSHQEDYVSRKRIAECKTYFDVSSVTKEEIGALLSLDEFNAMFPLP